MTSNVKTVAFDPLWKYDGKSINEFTGIELEALFVSQYCCDDEPDHSMTLFSLKDMEFTPENLYKQIEEHKYEIIPENFHGADLYFRLYYKDTYGTIGGVGISVKEICALFGPDYYDNLVQKVNDEYMNSQMCVLE
jgi:hypothetical protein